MTATTWASTLKPGEIVPWGGLERAAFEDFPEVVQQLRGGEKTKFSKMQLALFIPFGVLVVVIYATQIWAIATVVGPWALSQTSKEQPTLWQSADYVAAVQASVERVGDEDQLAISSDLRSAVDDLAGRGVITAAEATLAHAAKLGELGTDMSRAQVHP